MVSRLQLLLKLAALLLVGLSGCDVAGQNGADAGRAVDGARDVAQPTTTCPAASQTPSFQQDVMPFLSTRCTVCHSTTPRDGGFAPQAQNFETYAGFRPWAEESVRSLRQGTMPPPESDPPAPQADICMFTAWVEAGAPNN